MKKLIVCILVALLIVGIGNLPQRILASSQRYPVVTPQPYLYQPQVACNGVVMADQGVKLLVGSGVVVKELYADNGSWVEAGQVVAVTEPPAAQEAFLNQPLDSSTGLSEMSPTQLESLAAQYGLDASAAAQLSGQDKLLEALQEDTVTPAEKHAVAPISGILTWNAASKGIYLPAGSQLCTILGVDRYKAVVQVSADKAAQIEVGAAAVLTGKEIDHKQYNGTVTYVGNTITQGITAGGYSATIQVELTVDAPPDSIRHGASISCTIAVDQPQTLLTLPYDAIHQDASNQEYVYLVVGERLKKQPIQTGLELGECVQVVAGVSPQDCVATVDTDQPEKRFMLE